MYAQRHEESGTLVAEVSRKLVMSERPLYRRKHTRAGMESQSSGDYASLAT